MVVVANGGRYIEYGVCVCVCVCVCACAYMQCVEGVVIITCAFGVPNVHAVLSQL